MMTQRRDETGRIEIPRGSAIAVGKEERGQDRAEQMSQALKSHTEDACVHACVCLSESNGRDILSPSLNILFH